MVLIFNDSPTIPNRTVGAYRIATALRRSGVEVEVVDYLSFWDYDKLLKYIDSIPKIDWIGFSTKFPPPKKRTFTYLLNHQPDEDNIYLGILTKMKESVEKSFIEHIKSKNIKIVVGGPNADLIHNYIEVDIICVGYSDIGVVAVHNHIASEFPLIFKQFNNTKIVDCDINYPVNDLSNLDTEYHYTDFIQGEEVFPIEIGRGCIFHCAFCEFGHLGKKPGTYIRPKESIKKDILDRYTKYGTTKFLFVDDTFNDSVDKMHIIREIREELGIDFEFWSYCRLDLLAAKPEMVDLIPQIGWTSFTCGVETFNRASGKAVGKGADPEKLKQFLIYLRQRFPDLKIQINIIIGLPHDTEESARETVQWFLDHPEITHLVKISLLVIRNPEERKYTSKMSLNPDKYGYTVKSNNKLGSIFWQTKSLDTISAYKLREELQELLRKNKEKSTKSRDGIATMHNDPVIIKDKNGNIVNTMKYKVNHYIAQKLEHRGIF